MMKNRSLNEIEGSLERFFSVHKDEKGLKFRKKKGV
jgi:hypothetical protein